MSWGDADGEHQGSAPLLLARLVFCAQRQSGQSFPQLAETFGRDDGRSPAALKDRS